MFGTLGFSEIIIILVIVLIIFGAGRLPQIGEGVGKALKGFKKEVQDVPPPFDPNATAPPSAAPEDQNHATPAQATEPISGATPLAPGTPQAHQLGTEQTPGTTAALSYSGIRPEPVQPAQQQVAPPPQTVSPQPVDTPQPVSMEQRTTAPPPQPKAQYPPLPPSARATPGSKRPSAVVNKDAVARVQAQRAAMQSNAAQKSGGGTDDLQSMGEGLGSALRTFRQATADVKNSIDPEMRTIQAELEAAQKEVGESIEAAKQPPLPKEPPSST